MPAPPRPSPPDHTARVAFAGIYDDARWANVFWVRNGNSVTPSDADLNGLAQSLYAFYSVHFLPLLSQALTLEGCQIIYYGPGGLQIGGGHVENTNGAHAAVQLPASVAAGVSWHVQQRYRGGHPRTYFCGITQDRMSNSTTFTTAFVDSLRIAAGGFLTDVNAHVQGAFSQAHLGTVSFVLNKEWRTPPVFRDFTPGATSADNRIDTQRRRLGPDR